MTTDPTLTIMLEEVCVEISNIHPCNHLEVSGNELKFYGASPCTVILSGEYAGRVEGHHPKLIVTKNPGPSEICTIRLHLPELTEEYRKRKEHVFAVQLPLGCSFSFREGSLTVLGIGTGIQWHDLFRDPRQFGDGLPLGVVVLPPWG